jgi:hypothetical protein
VESVNTIRERDAIAMYDADTIEAVLAHGRHREDEDGVYWLENEFAELIELVTIEQRRTGPQEIE